MADKTLEIRRPHGADRASAAEHVRKIVTHRRGRYTPYIDSIRHAPTYTSWNVTGQGYEARLEVAQDDIVVRIHLKSLPLKWLAKRIKREACAVLERELPVQRFYPLH